MTIIPHPWYGSILWGVEFEGSPREEQRKRLAAALDGLSVAVFSEAQVVSYPELFTDARELNPHGEHLLHLNAMSVWAKESVYWPRQNELRRWADADPPNRYLWRNGKIAEGWPGTRLLNTTALSLTGYRGMWGSICEDCPDGCEGYFLDEAHDTRGWLSPPENWPGELKFRAAILSQIRLATAFGGAPCWINGTAAPTPASPRRYIQNAGASDPGYILNQCLASCEAQPENSRRILIQVDPRLCQSSLDFDFWSALAAVGDAGVEFNRSPWDTRPADRWSNHRPGTWGHGELDENDNPLLSWADHTVSREFDHATVTVDLRARTAMVEGR